jgi:hypothetical protein
MCPDLETQVCQDRISGSIFRKCNSEIPGWKNSHSGPKGLLLFLAQNQTLHCPGKDPGRQITMAVGSTSSRWIRYNCTVWSKLQTLVGCRLIDWSELPYDQIIYFLLSYEQSARTRVGQVIVLFAWASCSWSARSCDLTYTLRILQKSYAISKECLWCFWVHTYNTHLAFNAQRAHDPNNTTACAVLLVLENYYALYACKLLANS